MEQIKEIAIYKKNETFYNKNIIKEEIERYQYKVREFLISNKEFLLRITNELKEKRHLLYSDIQRIKKDFKIIRMDE